MDPSPRALRVLLSGFEPFDTRALNMSDEVVKALACEDASLGSVMLETIVLPVEYERAASLLLEQIERSEPELILCLGESTSLGRIELEQCAKNYSGGRADNRGVRQLGAIMSEQPETLSTSLDLLRLHGLAAARTDAIAMNEAVLVRARSEDRAEVASATVMAIEIDTDGTGDYVCNDLYFRAMAALGPRALPILFVHVPTTAGVKSVGDVAQAIRAVLAAAAELLV